MNSAAKPVSVKLDPDIRARIEELARNRRRTPHWLMREAIEEYLDREEKRENLRREALAAWEKFQDDGLHLTAEEADAWLAGLAAGRDEDPPACHL